VERTRLQTQLYKNGDVFRAPAPIGLVFTVNSIGSGPTSNASITVCRSSGTSENQGGASCFDGRDNDCDGLTVRDW
jgi:hypothetical protein